MKKSKQMRFGGLKTLKSVPKNFFVLGFDFGQLNLRYFSISFNRLGGMVVGISHQVLASKFIKIMAYRF